VTKLGTHLPLTITHQTFGELIGARRPTVTLALHELTDRGALITQPNGWLLTEPAARPTRTISETDAPTLETSASPWLKPAEGQTLAEPIHPARDRSEDRQWVRAAAEQQRRKAAMLRERSRALRDQQQRLRI